MTGPNAMPTPDAPLPDRTEARTGGGARLWLELAIVIPLSAFWFFWGTGVGDFVTTEAFRANIVKEMLQSDEGIIPTLHGRTYIRKLPLYTWTTAALARAAGGLNERVARWPSATLGVLFVIAIYLGARWLISPRAAPAAAALACSNWLVLDYGMRADLDIGVLTFSTIAVLLLAVAWMNPGTRRTWALAGCYAAALVGSFWKAPHVLGVVWLTLIGIAWIDWRAGRREWKSFVFHPLQIGLSLLCLAVLGGWTWYVSQHVGVTKTTRFIGIELLARVIPHKPSNFFDILLTIPEFIVACLPAVLIAGVMCVEARRPDFAERPRRVYNFLLAWFVPTFLFLLIVPAKASRYHFLLLGAVILLATMAWARYERGGISPPAERWMRSLIVFMYVVGVVAGLTCFVSAALFATHVIKVDGVANLQAAAALGVCGLVLIPAAVVGARQLRRGNRFAAGMLLILMLFALKPVQVALYLPARAASMTWRPRAALVDALVPADQRIYLIPDKPGHDRSGELAELAYYAERKIYWPDDEAEAVALASGNACYVLVRAEARARLETKFADRIDELAALRWEGDEAFLMRLDISQPP